MIIYVVTVIYVSVLNKIEGILSCTFSLMAFLTNADHHNPAPPTYSPNKKITKQKKKQNPNQNKKIQTKQKTPHDWRIIQGFT